ncbi:hypothetical protein J5X84_39770 [Streptosporangiaceae bacterium NEAU-GS5]|nr:hypothetical protein [Streptosporangiaceae bacterium NEAU-GS5]
MYPELTWPLVGAFAAVAGFVLFLLAFRPVLRRLAVRQVSRRPAELVLVIVGSMLGTALIVASLTVGDSLNRSVRQSAYDTLGQIDERVTAPTAAIGDQVAARLGPLRADRRVDGLLTVRSGYAAASTGTRAEPRVQALEIDFLQADRHRADRSALGAHPLPSHRLLRAG